MAVVPDTLTVLMSDAPVINSIGLDPANPVESKFAYAYASTAFMMLNFFGLLRREDFLRRAMFANLYTIGF